MKERNDSPKLSKIVGPPAPHTHTYVDVCVHTHNIKKKFTDNPERKL